jgi:hypothetical protein
VTCGSPVCCRASASAAFLNHSSFSNSLSRIGIIAYRRIPVRAYEPPRAFHCSQSQPLLRQSRNSLRYQFPGLCSCPAHHGTPRPEPDQRGDSLSRRSFLRPSLPLAELDHFYFQRFE